MGPQNWANPAALGPLALVAGQNVTVARPSSVASSTAGELPDAHVPENVRSVFERVDRNQDGALTRAELIRALLGDLELQALLELPAKVGDDQRAVFEEAFQGMDKDDGRSISLPEFAAFLRRAHRQPVAVSLGGAALALEGGDAGGRSRPEGEQEPKEARGFLSKIKHAAENIGEGIEELAEELVDGAAMAGSGSGSDVREFQAMTAKARMTRHASMRFEEGSKHSATREVDHGIRLMFHKNLRTLPAPTNGVTICVQFIACLLVLSVAFFMLPLDSACENTGAVGEWPLARHWSFYLFAAPCLVLMCTSPHACIAVGRLPEPVLLQLARFSAAVLSVPVMAYELAEIFHDPDDRTHRWGRCPDSVADVVRPVDLTVVGQAKWRRQPALA